MLVTKITLVSAALTISSYSTIRQIIVNLLKNNRLQELGIDIMRETGADCHIFFFLVYISRCDQLSMQHLLASRFRCHSSNTYGGGNKMNLPLSGLLLKNIFLSSSFP